MTKKHFEMLAEALKSTHASDATIAAVAKVCKTVNPGFSEERFKDAIKKANMDKRVVASELLKVAQDLLS